MTGPAHTEEPIRELSADDIGIGPAAAVQEHASNRPDDPPLFENDPRLEEVRGLLEFFGGVIFFGPPGTSKTWYAAKVGEALVDGDSDRIRFVQFHPSYQYEDFMQGFVPKKDGSGFEMRNRHFLEMCRKATKDPEHDYVLVIDELSRGDPGRIFGEALTYVEKSKRGLHFQLATGDDCCVPPNLFILATMNPFDRGVDEVDAAFERRFAKIAMLPDRTILRSHLESNGVEEGLVRRVIGFFGMVNGIAVTNPQGAIGHTYFRDVRDEETLASLWNHQLRFVVEKAYRLDPTTRRQIEEGWNHIFTGRDEGIANTITSQGIGDAAIINSPSRNTGAELASLYSNMTRTGRQTSIQDLGHSSCPARNMVRSIFR